MCKILDHLHTYVPQKRVEVVTSVPDGSVVTHDDYQLGKILLGGDQLTVARIHGAQAARSSHETAIDRLEGVEAVIEDWHARQVLMQVSVVTVCLCMEVKVIHELTLVPRLQYVVKPMTV